MSSLERVKSYLNSVTSAMGSISVSDTVRSREYISDEIYEDLALALAAGLGYGPSFGSKDGGWGFDLNKMAGLQLGDGRELGQALAEWSGQAAFMDLVMVGLDKSVGPPGSGRADVTWEKWRDAAATVTHKIRSEVVEGIRIGVCSRGGKVPSRIVEETDSMAILLGMAVGECLVNLRKDDLYNPEQSAAVRRFSNRRFGSNQRDFRVVTAPREIVADLRLRSFVVADKDVDLHRLVAKLKSSLS